MRGGWSSTIFYNFVGSINLNANDLRDDRFEGLVIKSTGSWYKVLPVEHGVGEMFVEDDLVECRLRGALRLQGSRSTNPVVVGDRVEVVRDAQSADGAVIERILERENCVVRRSSNLSKESHVLAANVDRMYLVITVHSPRTALEFVDRVLVTAGAYRIETTIVINKIDLVEGDEDAALLRDEYVRIYELAGYEVLQVSAVTGVGVAQLHDRMRGCVSLVTGNSGVGKSTLVNALDPLIGAKVGRISSHHHKGMHTTTFSEIFPLHSGGYLIDTPGVKGFGLVGIDERELCRYFPDMMRVAPACQYYNCTHMHEPGCAVMEAVARGAISESRYESYIKMMEDNEQQQKYRK